MKKRMMEGHPDQASISTLRHRQRSRLRKCQRDCNSLAAQSSDLIETQSRLKLRQGQAPICKQRDSEHSLRSKRLMHHS